MIEEHYLVMIWRVIGLKENQDLTNEEKQSRIRDLLIGFKREVKEYTIKDTKLKLMDEFAKIASSL